MASLKQSHGLDITVYGIDCSITHIVPVGMKAIGLKIDADSKTNFDPSHPSLSYQQSGEESEMENAYNLFTKTSVAIVYGIQAKAVQGMLDFDFACGRRKRSVCCMLYPFGEKHFRKFYWGTNEVSDSLSDSAHCMRSSYDLRC